MGTETEREGSAKPEAEGAVAAAAEGQQQEGQQQEQQDEVRLKHDSRGPFVIARPGPLIILRTLFPCSFLAGCAGGGDHAGSGATDG